MSPIRARRVLRRSRRRLALAVVVVLATIGAVAMHHGMPMDMHEMPAAAMCLAVLGTGAAVAIGAAPAFALRMPMAGDWLLPVTWISEPRGVPARAGPLYLRLSVLRR